MLPLREIFQYGKCNENSRNFREGEKVLAAGQIILCGTHESSHEKWSIYALVLQTTALSSPPHTVTGTIMKNSLTIKEFICTCKAGASQCCKHVLAVLLRCYRSDISSLDVLSTTDKKCLWKEMKGSALDAYKALPINTFHCYKEPDKLPDLSGKIDEDFIVNLCVNMLPDSAVAKHIKGRKLIPEISHCSDFAHGDINHPYKTEIARIFENANCSNRLMERLACYDIGNLNECCRNFYVSNVVTYNGLALCLESSLDKTMWQRERQFRITGSRCYAISTYMGNDWSTKSKNYFHSSTFSSLQTRHGLQYESLARQIYSESTGSTVVECGLVVSDINPWLGVSPDGVVFIEKKPAKIIEIKCPYEGRNLSINEILPLCKYISRKQDGSFSLKKKHCYYGQVTLGMAVLNIKQCDFVIFCSKDNSFFIETVDLDEHYVVELLASLKGAYFNKMIHNICSA